MTRLVELATAALGPPEKGDCFWLKLPAVLGGAYTPENIGTVPLSEAIASSGSIAFQIKDVPDGGKVAVVIE